MDYEKVFTKIRLISRELWYTYFVSINKVSFPGTSIPGSQSREEEEALRRYEVIFISVDDLSVDEFENLLDRYKSIVTDLGGTIVKVDRWGKRRLAYQIQKRREGVYTLVNFVGEEKIVPELERNFRIDDRILRYLSVKLEDKVDMEQIEQEIAKAKEAEIPPEAPAPAEEAAVPEEGVQDQGSEEEATAEPSEATIEKEQQETEEK